MAPAILIPLPWPSIPSPVPLRALGASRSRRRLLVVRFDNTRTGPDQLRRLRRQHLVVTSLLFALPVICFRVLSLLPLRAGKHPSPLRPSMVDSGARRFLGFLRRLFESLPIDFAYLEPRHIALARLVSIVPGPFLWCCSPTASGGGGTMTIGVAGYGVLGRRGVLRGCPVRPTVPSSAVELDAPE
jgi:hypothetical protein